MVPFLSQLIQQIAKRNRRGLPNRTAAFSQHELAKAYRQLKLDSITLTKDFFLILLGILSAAFGLESFILPSNFIDGGATGIALLLSEISDLSLSFLLILINIPFILLGYNIIGKQFAVKATLAIGGLAVAISIISFPSITHDKLLVALFGGFFLGAGIGLTVRGGAVLDGTEV